MKLDMKNLEDLDKEIDKAPQACYMTLEDPEAPPLSPKLAVVGYIFPVGISESLKKKIFDKRMVMDCDRKIASEAKKSGVVYDPLAFEQAPDVFDDVSHEVMKYFKVAPRDWQDFTITLRYFRKNPGGEWIPIAPPGGEN